MTQEEAASLLGVDTHAGPDEVRRAWRIWARLAHPDAGGDVTHFRRLAAARDELLSGTPLDPNPALEPTPRVAMRAVLRKPRLRMVTVAAFLVIAAAATVLLAPWIDPWVAALLLGAASTAAVVVLQRAVLTPGADAGHRITFLALTWLPLAAVLVVAVETSDSSIITALPAMVLPFVFAVAMANPGAGLWRPGARVDFSR